MRLFRLLGRGSAAGGVLLATALFTGCESLSSDPKYPEFQPPATNSSPAINTALSANATLATNSAPATNLPASNPTLFSGNRPEIINIGDSLTITFFDLPTPQTVDQQVRSDGTITLINNQTFKAEGKTRGELEKEIRARYVPDYYPRMTVTIKPVERFFFVGGEVRGPGAQIYRGPITVLKAIQSAGDFTDYAQRKKVRLTRLNGKTEVINCLKAREDSRLDPPVYPGDNIYVPRRIF